MTVVNRRNALLGWATWKIAHNLAKRKARQALPAESRSKKPAIAAAGAAALAGSLLFWRKARRRTEDVQGGGGGGGHAE
jgi:hypothetical protein